MLCFKLSVRLRICASCSLTFFLYTLFVFKVAERTDRSSSANFLLFAFTVVSSWLKRLLHFASASYTSSLSWAFSPFSSSLSPSSSSFFFSTRSISAWLWPTYFNKLSRSFFTPAFLSPPSTRIPESTDMFCAGSSPRAEKLPKLLPTLPGPRRNGPFRKLSP